MKSRYWSLIVKRYTLCDLTLKKDKLVALSGIARKIQGLLGSDYVAGLWRDQLPYALLWSVNSHTGGPCYRAKEYIAPWWAWTSIEGCITYPAGPYELPNSQCESLSILDASITLANPENPFGQAKDGFLRVRGRLGMATWISPDTPANWIENTSVSIANYLPPVRTDSGIQHPRSFEVCPSNDGCASILLNDVTESSERHQAFFLPIVLSSHRSEGLLLLSLPCGRFVRIGMMSIWDQNQRVKEILNSFIERELTII